MPSTVIKRFRYVAEERRLEVIFTSGRRYSYLDVPPEVATAFGQAFAKGEFFNANIRRAFRFRPEPAAEF